MSVCEIETSETYEKGKPKRGGLSDPRMGTMDRGTVCETDGADSVHNPGYFGHLELAKPVYHHGFLNVVLKVLRCVGYSSSRILLDPETDARFNQIMRIQNPKHRLKKLTDACKTRTECPHTGTAQPSYRCEGMKITANFEKCDEELLPDGGERKVVITAEKALQILKNISDEDCRLLGLDPEHARPDWFILQVMPIPPPPVRPSVSFDASTRSEDDLTVKLMEIVRTNKNLQRQEQNGAPAHVVDEFAELLQYHIMTFMDNTVAGQPRAMTRSGDRLRVFRNV